MKKFFLIINLVCCIFILSACKGNDNTNDGNSGELTNVPTKEVTEGVTPTIEENLTIADYYPFNLNTKYTYEGEGIEYASYTVYTDYTREGKVQLRENNGGTETVKVLQFKDGILKRIISRGECYYRENLMDTTAVEEEVLLKEPLTVGTKWTLSDNSVRKITNVNVDITTPTGTYKVLEVTTEGNETTQIDYYAKDIGLIKTITKTGDMEVTSTLSKIETNTPLVQSVLFYYPNYQEDGLREERRELTFNTNDITSSEIEEGLKNLPDENYAQVISDNTKINNLYLDNNNIVHVDFTEELVTETNAGVRYEEMILECITNTLATYYGVNEVIITIEGKPYESGHYYMEEGETFQVNYEDVLK